MIRRRTLRVCTLDRHRRRRRRQRIRGRRRTREIEPTSFRSFQYPFFCGAAGTLRIRDDTDTEINCNQTSLAVCGLVHYTPGEHNLAHHKLPRTHPPRSGNPSRTSSTDINSDKGSISPNLQGSYRGYRPRGKRKHVLRFVAVLSSAPETVTTRRLSSSVD